MKGYLQWNKIKLNGESGRGLKWEYIPLKTHSGQPNFNLKLEIPKEEAHDLSGALSDGGNVNYLSHFKFNGLQFSATEKGELDLGSAYNSNHCTCGSYGFQDTLEESIKDYLKKVGRMENTQLLPTQLISTLAICSAAGTCRNLQEFLQSALSSIGNALLELIIVGFCYDVYWSTDSIGANKGFKLIWNELPEDVQAAFPLKER